MLQALLDGDQSPDIENSIDLSPSVTANARSREEVLISILNSHPWSPVASTAFNLANKYGQNLAHLCAQLGYHRLLTCLIEWGLDINVKDANGWTPLDFARFYGDLDAVDILEGGWEDDVEVLEQSPPGTTQIRSIDSPSPQSSPGSVQTAQPTKVPAKHEPPHSQALPTNALLPTPPATALEHRPSTLQEHVRTEPTLQIDLARPSKHQVDTLSMPRGSLDVALTEAYYSQQQPEQEHQPLREYLVRAEMWYKNSNALHKVSTCNACVSLSLCLRITRNHVHGVSIRAHVVSPSRPIPPHILSCPW